MPLRTTPSFLLGRLLNPAFFSRDIVLSRRHFPLRFNLAGSTSHSRTTPLFWFFSHWTGGVSATASLRFLLDGTPFGARGAADLFLRGQTCILPASFFPVGLDRPLSNPPLLLFLFSPRSMPRAVSFLFSSATRIFYVFLFPFAPPCIIPFARPAGPSISSQQNVVLLSQ